MYKDKVIIYSFQDKDLCNSVVKMRNFLGVYFLFGNATISNLN